MRANYAEADFERAVDLVSSQPEPSILTDRLGIEWDYLAWLALGVAREVVEGEGIEHPLAVANGAEAFTAGFLVGAYLADPPAERGAMLTWAVEAVGRRGRHAVIADYCDLGAVARLEEVYAAALTESVDAPGVDPATLRHPVTRLFESGLATGLVLPDVASSS